MFVMEPRVAKSLLVSKVLAADGLVSENEKAFLERAMKRLGVQPEERRAILAFEGWDDAERALAHLSIEDKRELISQLVDASSADGRLSPLEAAMVKRIAESLGVDP